ncbi:MAG: transposase [Candidatus Paceibacterota bacterium]|jgi:putative transposase
MKRGIETGGIYHIYNRGVEKRKVFLDENDHLRFVSDLFEFNDKNPVINLNYHPIKHVLETKLPKEEIVEILAFCLMPNHFHLLLRQKEEKGIAEFMQKMGTGYTNYFNKRYNRVGSLFQGKYKSVGVTTDAHLLHLPYYIHSNPLDLVAPKWRKGEIENYKKAITFLEQYRWSSYLDYIGKTNFPSITQRKFILSLFRNEKEYKKEMLKWLKERSFESVETLALE